MPEAIAPQIAVVALLVVWGRPVHALAIAGLILAQALMMRRFVGDPLQRAVWYSGFGVPLYVSGMLVSAFALRSAGVPA